MLTGISFAAIGQSVTPQVSSDEGCCRRLEETPKGCLDLEEGESRTRAQSGVAERCRAEESR